MKDIVPFNRKNRDLISTGLNDFYNVIDDFFNGGFSQNYNTFKVDVQETDKEYLVEAELPGIKKEEVSLNLDDGRLTISVNREEKIEKENKNYVHKERRYSSMSRTLYLADAKLEEIKAKLDNGVLSITVQKEEKPATSVNIEIE